jgi:hypothetical protein
VSNRRTYELIARSNKAKRIAAFAVEAGYRADDVARFDASQWATISNLAESSKPASPGTQTLVVELLKPKGVRFTTPVIVDGHFVKEGDPETGGSGIRFETPPPDPRGA